MIHWRVRGLSCEPNNQLNVLYHFRNWGWGCARKTMFSLYFDYYICNFSYFPFWLWGLDLGSDCFRSWYLHTFNFDLLHTVWVPIGCLLLFAHFEHILSSLMSLYFWSIHKNLPRILTVTPLFTCFKAKMVTDEDSLFETVQSAHLVSFACLYGS